MNSEALKVFAKLNKKFGPETVVLGTDIREDLIGRMTTGSLAVDVILGGGWPTNQWHELIGEASNGKTALALKTIAANQARDPEFTTVWVAAEQWVPSYAELCGVDVSHLAWLTYFNYLKFSNSDATPSGIREFSDENSSIVSDVKMYSLEKNVKANVELYKGKMLTFIRVQKVEDGTKFPLYKEKCNNDFGFAITSIDKASDVLIKVNKAIVTNE